EPAPVPADAGVSPRGPGRRTGRRRVPPRAEQAHRQAPVPARGREGLRAMELGLRGNKAVVTGASRGLGRAIALELAREGCDLAVCARGEADLTEAARELGEVGGGTVHAEPIDVTDPEQVRAFVARAAGALGGIDVLVNNAGRAVPGTFESLTDEDWRGDIGYVESSQWDRVRERRAPELDREEFFRRTVEGEVPLGRFGKPEEVSGLVAFLVSGRASYITGASIDVAGGMGRYL